MKYLEYIKLLLGLILIGFCLIIGFSFFVEAFGSGDNIFDHKVSMIFSEVRVYPPRGSNLAGNAGGASNTVIFFGLSGLAGAYLLGTIKRL